MPTTDRPKLGIIAGGGALPRRIWEACAADSRPVFVVALTGHCDPATVSGAAHEWVDLAAVGRTVEILRRAACQEVVLAGSVGRPDLTALKPDWVGIKLLPRVIAAAARGDDALLKVLVSYLESKGFQVVGAHDCLADLLAPAGLLTQAAPSPADRVDIARGIAVARALGQADVGQAAVVRDGLVIGVEAVEGTDRLLERCRDLAPPGRGGVLVKWPKPGQERRVDLPTVGVTTVENAAAARLNGLALAAGGALIVDRAAVVAAADRLGLFVVADLDDASA